MDKKILAVVAVVVIIIAAAAVIMLKPGDSDKDSEKSGYTVSFDANGGSGTMDPVKNVTGTYIMPESKFTPPENHSFIGWSLTLESPIIWHVGTEVDMEEDITLYAKWSDNADFGIDPVIEYKGGITSLSPIVSDIVFIFNSKDKTSTLNLDTLEYAYYYGSAKMRIDVDGSTDWSCHTETVSGLETTTFEFTYDGEKYALAFSVPGGTVSGNVDSFPMYTFSTEGKATLNVCLQKLA